MKINTAARHMREGSKNVLRNGWMSFASISAISISLFILGVFLLLALNVGNLAGDLESQVEIKVFLDVAVPEDEVASIQNDIGLIPGVSKVTFVPKEEGMDQLLEKFDPEFREVLEGYKGDNNPLPDAFIVKVEEPKDVSVISEKIKSLNEGKELPPIMQVDYGGDTVEKLFQVTGTVRLIGIVLVAGLAFTAMFLIANTIKLTILARSREISIMKLVGATNGFIRWPFFIEGALLGIIGSAIPIVVLLIGYSSIVGAGLGIMSGLMPLEQVGWMVFGLLIAIGVVIGIWGSTLSVRKFLRV